MCNDIDTIRQTHGQEATMSETIPLLDAVRALRTAIMAAADAASTQAIRFELGQIELEFQVVAKSEKGAEGKLGGKIDFHIFSVDASLGGSGKLADERTQKVKFVLSPKLIDTAGKASGKIDISRRKQSRRAS
jgi:Trypsin-co-occurring domain 2